MQPSPTSETGGPFAPSIRVRIVVQKIVYRLACPEESPKAAYETTRGLLNWRNALSPPYNGRMPDPTYVFYRRYGL